MTPNDAQIDVLIRRYARHSQSNSATEHLDADELNAFAEGTLPEAARSRYVSHLVDCDNCRQIVSQLAISSGAVAAAEASPAREASGYSWWKRLSGFFAPMTLRYAAFAMVLITVAGVVFLVTRRPREPNLVAQNEQTKQAPVSAVKPPNDAMPQTNSATQAVGNENKSGLATQPSPISHPSPSSDEILRLDASKAGDIPISPPKPAKEGEVTSSPSLAASKKAAPVETETVPSYAPPPPVVGQRAETQSRQQQNVAGVASVSGPRQSQQQPIDTFKMPDRGREAEAGKDNREDDKSHIALNQSSTSKRAGDEKVKGPRRDLENNAAMNRNSNEVRDEARTQGVLTMKPSSAEEKPPETRSAGGRKFKRQGSAWVDAKFKSSMTLKSISRGSSEFDGLDSGLRAIAQQLGGEVIVVWKNKAYLIK